MNHLSSSSGFESDAFFLSSEDNISFGRYSIPFSLKETPAESVRKHPLPTIDLPVDFFEKSVKSPPPRPDVHQRQDHLLSLVTAPKDPQSPLMLPTASSPSPTPSPSPLASIPTPFGLHSNLSFGVLPMPPTSASSIQATAYGTPPPSLPPSTIQATAYGTPPPSLPPSTIQATAYGTPPPSLPPSSIQATAYGTPPPSLPPSTIQATAYGTPPPSLPPSLPPSSIQATAYGTPPPSLSPSDEEPSPPSLFSGPSAIQVSAYAASAPVSLSSAVFAPKTTQDPSLPSVPSAFFTSYGSPPAALPSSSAPISAAMPTTPASPSPSAPASTSPQPFKGYLSELVSTDAAHPKGETCERDWNGDFQRAMEGLRSLTPNTRHEDRVKVYQVLARLSEDFVWTVKTYGRIIISEASVPVAGKTIKPVNIGGVAGGEKFVVQGVLFKFALDTQGLYCSDHNAGKAGGHELKSLTHLFNTFVKDLSFPMMAICDYRGFRLIGMTVLPIRGDSTLVYGSSDAGATVKADPYVNSLLVEVGKRLNLRAHPVGPAGADYRFHTPLDLEVHRGSDGRYYVLDLARLFPPQSPSLFPYQVKDKATQECAYLFRLLRPEYVRKFARPLSSDAFSNFGSPPQGCSAERVEESKACLREVHEATKFLYTRAIVESAGRLVRNRRSNFPEFKAVFGQLVLYLHASGVNLRFLGMVRDEVMKLRDAFWGSVLLVEMLARLLKDNLKLLLRTEMRRLRSPGEAAYCRALVARLNLFFGHSDESLAYWRDVLTPDFYAKYPLPSQHALPITQGDDLREELIQCGHASGYGDGRSLLIFRVSELVGLFFIKDTWKHLTRGSTLFAYPSPFHETDLLEMKEKISYMNISAHSQGFVLKLLAVSAVDSNERLRLLQRAKLYFKTALTPNPNNKVTLRNLADCYMECDENFEALKCYQYAMLSDPNDTNTLMKFAMLFDKIGLSDDAEDLYLRSVAASPNHSNCLTLYADFLWLVRNEPDRAELFYHAALKSAPNNLSAHNNYAVFRFLQKEERESVYPMFNEMSRWGSALPLHVSNSITFNNLVHSDDHPDQPRLYRRLSELKSRRTNIGC